MNNRSDKHENHSVRMSLRGRILLVYDFLLLLFTDFVILFLLSPGTGKMLLVQMLLSVSCIFAARKLGNIYRQVWRYGGASTYLLLIVADGVGGCLYMLLQFLLPAHGIHPARALSVVAVNLLLTLCIRLAYKYLYDNVDRGTLLIRVLRKLVMLLTGLELASAQADKPGLGNRIKVAIIGAGRIGVMLAEELQNNARSSYAPCCFIDIDPNKIGREILGLPVFSVEESNRWLNALQVQEVVFALPEMESEQKKQLYDRYRSLGYKLKVYDFPVKQAEAGSRRQLRAFDIEELLFRKPRDFSDEKTCNFYRGKCVLISGGGGSIGSELCRQIAKMQPRQMIILDICENTSYELQQQMRIAYGDALDLRVEIVSVCDRGALEKIFACYQPEIVIHAAAHKHVPLMEHNVCQAVRNNVFGTLNIVETAEKYGVKRFIMVSTDKAVNPTNVMGATKRICEMLVQSRRSATCFSATRFGNVLGSNGSVIPLFQQQIANGGPVTITDKRIIRYFMTIPEASQLVLQTGAIAHNGELHVLDMGKPIKILDLAENLIRLSGYEPYKDIDIVETGLRPGEKLYEELLIKSKFLGKTENELIFVEKDTPLDAAAMAQKLEKLSRALEKQDDAYMKQMLMEVVTTYHVPEEVNAVAAQTEEMQLQM